MIELDSQVKKDLLNALKLLQAHDKEAVLLASSIFQVYLKCIPYDTYIRLFMGSYIREGLTLPRSQERCLEVCTNRYSGYIRRHLIDNYQFYVTVDKDNNFIIYEDYLHKTRYK